MQENFSEIKKSLKKELDKNRYEHTLGVMYTAGCLAMAHGYDMEKAMLAGLLHDCAKCIPNDEKLSLCKKNKIKLTDIEKDNPFLIHAKLGAFLAEKKYDVKDKDILHAILVHTTGCPDMNMLDKIIYIADYMEPNRDKAPNLNEVRSMCFLNLDETMVEILRNTLSYLEDNKDNIDPLTAETYEYYLNRSK